jgi:sugar phosphate isomerase/epimerase
MKFCAFSKRLGALGFAELGRALREHGFDAVDLTVRPGGHVEPERAREELPEAAAALAAEGVSVAMITTAITSPDSPGARGVLETAAGLGIGYAKLGYWRYEGFGTLRRSLAEAGARLAELAAAAAELGLLLGCHNHSGGFLGAHLAHLGELVGPLDPAAVGIYFDPAHAVVEGSQGGWLQSLDGVADRVRMLAIKDFAPPPDGEIDCVPLGQGVVPWPRVVAVLRGLAGQIGPVSVHAEREQPAAEALRTAAGDLAAFRELWERSAQLHPETLRID